MISNAGKIAACAKVSVFTVSRLSTWTVDRRFFSPNE